MAGRLEVGGIYSQWQGETASCSWRFLVHRTSKPVKRAGSAPLHSFNFCHHKVIGWTARTLTKIFSFVSFYLSRCLALLHAHRQGVRPSLLAFCVSAQSDLNRNNIVNWGYCEWRSQADRQPLFPALTAPHHSRKDTWFLNPHLSVPHLHCLLRSEPRPGIKVEFSSLCPQLAPWK